MGKASGAKGSVGPVSKPCSTATTKTNPVKNSTKAFSTGPSTKPAK